MKKITIKIERWRLVSFIATIYIVGYIVNSLISATWMEIIKKINNGYIWPSQVEMVRGWTIIIVLLTMLFISFVFFIIDKYKFSIKKRSLIEKET